ncbi:hypothetical protein H5410_028631 [Solanum commersonii]|uniref:Uncharacterized protein n=1 Tax=Solanum commersonii TaxID=4109 RepID=A0A9J5Z2H1_SOLCO|nr:hypothetical protein H5410_028631 [Solanum commersonii]
MNQGFSPEGVAEMPPAPAQTSKMEAEGEFATSLPITVHLFMTKYKKESQRKQRKILKVKNGEAIVGHSIFLCTSIPRRSRTKVSIKNIVKNGQKFNPSTSWLGYKKESRKKSSKDLDQMGDNWYSIPLSEYDIPDDIPNDLDELLWDKDVFNFSNDIPDLYK